MSSIKKVLFIKKKKKNCVLHDIVLCIFSLSSNFSTYLCSVCFCSQDPAFKCPLWLALALLFSLSFVNYPWQLVFTASQREVKCTMEILRRLLCVAAGWNICVLCLLN
jgi:hypothetical protein